MELQCMSLRQHCCCWCGESVQRVDTSRSKAWFPDSELFLEPVSGCRTPEGWLMSCKYYVLVHRHCCVCCKHTAGRRRAAFYLAWVGTWGTLGACGDCKRFTCGLTGPWDAWFRHVTVNLRTMVTGWWKLTCLWIPDLCCPRPEVLATTVCVTILFARVAVRYLC